jgi:hypothetical protein
MNGEEQADIIIEAIPFDLRNIGGQASQEHRRGASSRPPVFSDCFLDWRQSGAEGNQLLDLVIPMLAAGLGGWRWQELARASESEGGDQPPVRSQGGLGDTIDNQGLPGIRLSRGPWGISSCIGITMGLVGVVIDPEFHDSLSCRTADQSCLAGG